MASATSANPCDIKTQLAAWAGRFETVLAGYLEAAPSVPAGLAEAVRYSVTGGGKRIRAFLVTRSCELCGGSAEDAAPAAAAIECIHAFSLVHDDLPAMDDDDVRRGRPTNHKVFGEAMAILAGDALCVLAFDILSGRIGDPQKASSAVGELARATGWGGMIGGQVSDMQGEGRPIDLAMVQRIHRYKTARLLESATRLGAICAGADKEKTEAVASYGDQLGRAFQIADDLLDITGDAEVVGKALAKDAAAGKQTYPAAVGEAKSRAAADEAVQKALDALAIFGSEADDLRQLVRFVVDRDM